MWIEDKKKKPLRDLIEDAPKTLNKDYLQNLYSALFCQKLERDIDVESIVNSLLLEVINENSVASNRHFAYVILQKLNHDVESSKIILADLGQQLIHVFPILITQNIKSQTVIDVLKKLIWCLYNENWSEEMQCCTLAFLCKAIASPDSPLIQDDIKKLSSLLSSWLIIPSTASSIKSSSFRKSSSSLSITEIDGTDIHDFFSVLNYAPTITPVQFRSIYVFSMLRSYLCSNKSTENSSKPMQSFLGGFSSENLSFSTQEYCMRIIDQVDRRVQSSTILEFQKICLVEAIELFNTICLMDPAIIHSIFPLVRRIYDQISSNLPKEPELQDVAVLCSCMQFFMNHGSSVMHKPDSLYMFLFCDMLSLCFKDNYISYEILNLMIQNRAQLCYHSSILEKYFPTFFKVLAWRPNTFAIDFQEILPAFMSQHTSLEIFYSLLDLPCLTAVLMLMDNKSCSLDPKIFRDPKLLEAFKNPVMASVIKHLLRETSGNINVFENIQLLHQTLQNLTSHHRVICCSHAVIPLLKCYFQVLVQYADMSMIVLIIPAILDRLCVIYSVENYSEEIHNILADSIIKLFELHPETVFHCQKNILSYLHQFKNYSVSEKSFINMVWIVGEYVSSVYSSICRPEVIALFFENLESTIYEALLLLKDSSDDQFLRFLSVALTTLSKLAARNQDQVPRAVLCLSKVHKQLKSFGNDYKKSWKIVTERMQELLSILNVPSIAAIVLCPPKDLESGRLHRDSTSLPYVLRTITDIVTAEN